MKPNDLSEIEVNDKIWTTKYGWMVVGSITYSAAYPIKLYVGTTGMSFTLDGKEMISNKYPTGFTKEMYDLNSLREIDWSKVPKDTKVLAGKSKYVHYFCVYLPNAHFKFALYDSGLENHEAIKISNWEIVTIHPDVEILDEWYKQ